jgi:hypothetical protein
MVCDGVQYMVNRLWPFYCVQFKPSPDNRIRELEKAGALIAAEIDRLQRKGLFEKEEKTNGGI